MTGLNRIQAAAAVFVLALGLAGCAARDVGRTIEVGGKIAYDSFKAANAPKSR